jgi:hypothetical protein
MAFKRVLNLLLFGSLCSVLSPVDAGGLYERALEHEDWIREVRRDFHKHPELGFEEKKTSEMIRERLDDLGVSYKCVNICHCNLPV